MYSSHRIFGLCTILLLLLIPPEVGRAQQGSSDWYKGFRFDSLFRVGADDNSLIDQGYLKDSLHFDFVRAYGGPSRITDSLLFLTPPDSLDTAWIAALGASRLQWLARLHVERWRQLWETGLKVVYPFESLRNLAGAANAAHAIEALFDYKTQYVHVSSFVDKIAPGGYAFLADTLFGGFARAIRIDSSSAAGMTLVVGRMGYVTLGLDLWMFDTTTRTVRPDTVERRHSLAIAMRVPEQFLPDTLPASTQLAELRLFARDTTWQTAPDSCRCFLYVPFDTLAITAGLYKTVPNWAMGAAFRDIIHTFRFHATRWSWAGRRPFDSNPRPRSSMTWRRTALEPTPSAPRSSPA